MLTAIIVILIIIMAQLAYLMFQNFKTKGIKTENISETLEKKTNQIKNLDRYYSPLEETSFEHALTLHPLFENLKKVTEENTRILLQKTLNGQLLNAGASAIRYAAEKNTFIVTFSKEAMQQLKAEKLVFMHSKGTIKAVLTNNGRVQEFAHLQSNAKALVSSASKLSMAVIGAANLISAADIAGKVQKISDDVSHLIEMRKHDQLGKLESIYKHTRELLAFEPSPEIQSMLLSLSKDLYELRSGWRREINRKLLKIEDPENRDWYKKFFSTQKSVDNRIVDEISACEQDFRYIELSMLLQLLIFDSIGKADVFIKVSLPDELNQFKSTLELFEEKNKLMALSASQASVAPTITYFKNFIQRYKSFQPGELSGVNQPEEIYVEGF
jgi:hypothetical protein